MYVHRYDVIVTAAAYVTAMMTMPYSLFVCDGSEFLFIVIDGAAFNDGQHRVRNADDFLCWLPLARQPMTSLTVVVERCDE